MSKIVYFPQGIPSSDAPVEVVPKNPKLSPTKKKAIISFLIIAAIVLAGMIGFYLDVPRNSVQYGFAPLSLQEYRDRLYLKTYNVGSTHLEVSFSMDIEDEFTFETPKSSLLWEDDNMWDVLLLSTDTLTGVSHHLYVTKDENLEDDDIYVHAKITPVGSDDCLYIRYERKVGKLFHLIPFREPAFISRIFMNRMLKDATITPISTTTAEKYQTVQFGDQLVGVQTKDFHGHSSTTGSLENTPGTTMIDGINYIEDKHRDKKFAKLYLNDCVWDIYWFAASPTIENNYDDDHLHESQYYLVACCSDVDTAFFINTWSTIDRDGLREDYLSYMAWFLSHIGKAEEDITEYTHYACAPLIYNTSDPTPTYLIDSVKYQFTQDYEHPPVFEYDTIKVLIPGNWYAQRDIQWDINKFCNNAISQIDELYGWYCEDTESGDYAIPYHFNQKMEVTRCDSEVLSIRVETFVFAGGAHGSSFINGLNYDVRSGKRISITDLGEDIQPFCSTKIEEQAKSFEALYCAATGDPSFFEKDLAENIQKNLLSRDSFFFSEDGLVFADTYARLHSFFYLPDVFFTIGYSELQSNLHDYYLLNDTGKSYVYSADGYLLKDGVLVNTVNAE